jgi:hypothetical protein
MQKSKDWYNLLQWRKPKDELKANMIKKKYNLKIKYRDLIG